MLDECESRYLECVTWIDRNRNLADAIPKNNAELAERLKNMMGSGELDLQLEDKWMI